MLLVGGATVLKDELFGRATNFRLAVNFRTDWVPSPSAGGCEENRTPVQKPIHTGISERRHIFTFPLTVVECRTTVISISYFVTAGGETHRSCSPLK